MKKRNSELLGDWVSVPEEEKPKQNIFWQRQPIRPSEASTLKWWQGVAHLNLSKHEVVFSIIPLNVIIRETIKFYSWIKWGR